MPIPLDFMRGILGVFCILSAHMAGRAAAAVRRGDAKLSRLYGWILRTVLCGAVLIFRHDIDLLVMAIWTLAAVGFAGGIWDASRPKEQEDLTHEIFPE